MIAFMTDEKLPDWFVRLQIEIQRIKHKDAENFSLRKISLDAGLGPNYLTQLLKSEGRKNPQLIEMTKICAQLNISLVYLLTGVEMSQSDEEFLSLWSRLDHDARIHVMNVLRRIGPPTSS